MTTAVLFNNSAESFDQFNSAVYMPSARPLVRKYQFGPVSNSSFSSVQEPSGVIKRVRAEQLIIQARRLRRSHFWFFWGLYAPNRKVVESVIQVIKYCPTELLLEGYSVQNYGNGTVVLIKRTANYMTTINVGAKSLSYAKLRMEDHAVVQSGTCIIKEVFVASLFETL